ncbi:MAG: hypothetical protein PHO66_06685 [Eubacteriales bacterium]|nr:hypothetical protein [Eubacteriales bacterium]
MKKRQWKRTLLWTAVLAVFLCAAPLLTDKLSPYDVIALLSPRRSPYQGVVHVWQLSNFNAPYGSKTNTLNTAANRVERRLAGVYFEVETLSQSEYEERLSQGQTPDILSFSSNWQGDPVYFEDVSDVARLRAPFDVFLQKCPQALPWMASTKVVLANMELTGTSAPAGTKGQELLTHMLLYAPKAKKNTVVLAAGGTAWLPAILAKTDATALTGERGLPENWAALDDPAAWRMFRAGGCAYFIGDRSHAITMEALRQQEKTFVYEQIAWPGDWPAYLDIQYLAICKSDVAEKTDVCTTFLKEMTSQRTQNALLENMGCIPVIELDTQEMIDVDKAVYNSAQRGVTLQPFTQTDPQDVEQALLTGIWDFRLFYGD